MFGFWSKIKTEEIPSWVRNAYLKFCQKQSRWPHNFSVQFTGKTFEYKVTTTDNQQWGGNNIAFFKRKIKN